MRSKPNYIHAPIMCQLCILKPANAIIGLYSGSAVWYTSPRSNYLAGA